jgi:hypothetical protein
MDYRAFNIFYEQYVPLSSLEVEKHWGGLSGLNLPIYPWVSRIGSSSNNAVSG